MLNLTLAHFTVSLRVNVEKMKEATETQDKYGDVTIATGDVTKDRTNGSQTTGK